LISVIIIASHGFYQFTRHVCSKKIQYAFAACTIFAHAITSLAYWQKIYFAPGTFWTNPLPYGTFQESLTNPLTLFASMAFLVFFIVLIIIQFKKAKVTA